MRTGTIISLILLALVVAGGILNAQATDAVSQRYVAAAEELRVLTAEEMWERAAETASAYRETWEVTEHWLHLLISHADTDSVALALGRVQAGIDAQDQSLCQEACRDLREYAEHIHHRDAFTLGNIL